jgi:methyl-accepting chemotaxis protein
MHSTFLARLSLRAKLAGAFGATLVLLAAVTLIGTQKINALDGTTRDAKRGAFLDEQIMSMELATREAVDAESTALLYGAGPEVTKRLEAAWEQNDGDAFAEALAQAKEKAVEGMPERLDASEAAGAKIKSSVERTLALVRAGRLDAARENRADSTVPTFESFLKMNQAVEALSEEFSEGATKDAETLASGGKRMLLLFALAALLAASACAYLITRGVTGGVSALVARLRSLDENCVADLDRGLGAMAEGDLTVAVAPVTEPIESYGGDEIGQASETTNALISKVQQSIESYNAMRGQLGDMLGDISRTSNSLSAASQEMSATSQEAGRATDEIARAVGEMASGAEQQVRKVDSAKTLSDEMAGAAGRGAGEAEETSLAAQQAREVATGGADAVTRASDAMEAVRSSSIEATEAIRELGEKSEQITGIVETITGIAEQTNLLALNAAIEAARAGEQGRGFAVVAEEVRKLAEESQQAAASIAELIGEIRRETDKAVGVVEDSATRTQDGVETVDQARESFVRIGESVDQVTARAEQIADVIREISEASRRMQEDMGDVAAVAEESSAAAEQVSASTQQTSASTQQLSSSAQELARMAEGLESLVGRFTLA